MQKLNYISFLRVISIIIVVVFHVYGFMFAGNHFPETINTYKKLYFTINQTVIINIAMPLFTFISGYIFCYIYEGGGYRDFYLFIKKKAARLLLPYLVFGIVMMATTNNFHPLELLSGSYWHLWYLPLLFWLFVIAWGGMHILKQYRLLLLVLFFITAVLDILLPRFLGLKSVLVYMVWFMLGICTFDYAPRLIQLLRKYHFYIPLIIIWAFITYYYPTEYGDSNLFSVTSILCALISLYFLFSQYFNNVSNRVVFIIDKYSFGIYIFHNWIGLYCISRTAKRLLSLESMAKDHIVLFPLVLTIIVLGLSTMVTHFFLKTKVGRLLLG